MEEMPLDGKLKALVRRNINLGVPIYLSAAWAYYHMDKNFMSDTASDWMARELLKAWPTVAHRHKHLITEDELAAGTLRLAKDKYPEIVKGSAEFLLWHHQGHVTE